MKFILEDQYIYTVLSSQAKANNNNEGSGGGLGAQDSSACNLRALASFVRQVHRGDGTGGRSSGNGTDDGDGRSSNGDGDGGGSNGGDGDGGDGDGGGRGGGQNRGRGRWGRGRQGRGRWGRGGGGGGAEVRPPCNRGGAILIQIRLNRLERRLRNRFGPEGLGEQNDADDEEIPEGADPIDAEQDEEERHQVGGTVNSSGIQPVPEEPRLSSLSSGILSSLASIARDSIQEDSQRTKITTGVHPVLQSLVTGLVLSADQQSQVELNTNIQQLVLAAKRCQATEVLEASIQLNYWVSVIAFASQITRSVTKIYISVTQLIFFEGREN